MQSYCETQSNRSNPSIFLVHFLQILLSKFTMYPSGHISHSLILSGLISASTAGNPTVT